MRLLGIDLGTTNTVASIENYVHAISDQGGSTLPSVVAFLPNGTTQIGAAASRRRAIDSENTIFSSKRLIGRRYSDTQTAEFQERYPFEVVCQGDDEPAFKTRAGQFTPTQIASIILSAVHDKLKHLSWGLDAKIITVPAAYNASQRRATTAAAQQSGLGDVQLVDEPTAAAAAYMALPGSVKTAAVYDLGGGTFDFAVLDCTRRPPRLLANASDLFLGGDDIDVKIADWVAAQVLKTHNWDLRNYAEVEARLVAECERAKIRLSRSESTVVELAQVDPDCPAAAEGLPLSRAVMDDLSGPIVQNTFLTCDGVIRNAGLRASDLDAVFLAGGSSHIPEVQNGVEAYFGQRGRTDIEPTEVVAIGASLIHD